MACTFISYASAYNNMMNHQTRKRKSLYITHSDRGNSLFMRGNAGLRNQSVLCYSNAIFQAIASCNHLTTLFQTVLSDNQRCFRMNYEFVKLVHSILTQSDCVDPEEFLKLLTNCRKNFLSEECTYHLYFIH